MRALTMSLAVLALSSQASAAAPAPAEEAILIFVRLPSGKVVPVGAWKSDGPRVVKDVVAAREGSVEKDAWLWRAGAYLDDRLSLDASGVLGGDLLDLSAAKPERAAAPADSFDIELRTLTGIRVAVTVRPHTTMLEIKKAFQAAKGLAPERQHLVFEGKSADDARTVAELGIGPGAQLHLIVKPPKAN